MDVRSREDMVWLAMLGSNLDSQSMSIAAATLEEMAEDDVAPAQDEAATSTAATSTSP